MAININLNDVQSVPVVVNSSLTAALNKRYTVVASATFTDPSPVEGKGFIVFVINGTATVGGTGYSTTGTIIYRMYHSGAWLNKVYYDKAYLDTVYQAAGSYLTSSNITQTITNGVTDKAPSEDAVYDALALKLAKCHTLHFEHTQLGSGTASTAFIFAAGQATANTAGGVLRRLPSAITGHIYTVSVHSTIQTTFAGSTQQAILKIYNFTAGTSVTVGSTIQYDAAGQSYVYTLGTPFAVSAGDDLYCEITFPAWSSTVPAGIIHYIDALIYGF